MKKENCFAYVDGSYNPKTKVYGCGGFLVDQLGKKYIIKKSGNDPEMAKMRNVAGEILGASEAIKKALVLKMDHLTIYHDYIGIAAWALGLWKPKKRGTKSYAEFVKDCISLGLDITFKHVKGHSGNVFNDEADKLAKEAVGLK